MADDPWAAFNPQPAPKKAAGDDPWAQFNPEKPERGVLERAGEAAAETFRAGQEAYSRTGKDVKAEDYRGPSGMLRSAKETAELIASPITMTVGPIASGAVSLGASGMAGLQRGAQWLAKETGLQKKISPTPDKPIQSSEEAYEQALPGVEAATMALMPGRGAPGLLKPLQGPSRPPAPPVGTPGRPAADVRHPGKKPGRGDEAEAGRIIEELAEDPNRVRAALEAPSPDIVPGSKRTTFEVTDDTGLGQLERTAQTEEQAKFHALRQQRNAARLKVLQEAQAGGRPEDISKALRNIADANEAREAEAVRLGQEMAAQRIERMGGTNDPATYGEVLRQEIRNAEEAVRAEEKALWDVVDPGGTLRANPQPLQELERSIYGVMPEAGAAEASLTEAEQKVAKVIQNYKNIIPYQELRDLRHLINTELREELITSGQSPAYARLSRLRQGIADMEGNVFDEMGVRDPAAAERMRAASAATRERYEQFGRGPVGEILRREGSQGPFRVGESSVPEKFIKQGAKGYDSASEFLRASPGSLEEFRDAVAASARRAATDIDGVLDQRKLEGWMKRYQDTLRAIDERDGGAFSAQLRDVRTAQQMLAASEERLALVREQNEKGMLGQLIGTTEEGDITRRIGTIFGGIDRETRARELRKMVAGNPAAEAGLRRSVLDYMTERFLGTMDAGDGQTYLRASMFQKFVRENLSVLRQLMSPAQVDTLQAIAADLQSATKFLDTKMRGSSNTPQDIFNAARQSGLLSRLGGSLMHHVFNKFLGKFGGSALYKIGEGFLARGQEKDFVRIQRLIDRAVREPGYAKQLLDKAYKPRRRMGPAAAAYEAGAGENAPDVTPQNPLPGPFQAGGGVPAIGGTGGRSPGARQVAQAGGARRGPSQALQDGGEAREQQPASVAPRERFAAALQGQPTGAGFSGGSTQQRKPKMQAPMSREEMRRTLQSFGITGEEAGGFAERQLGERPVDSRARGGDVDPTETDEPNYGDRSPFPNRKDPGEEPPGPIDRPMVPGEQLVDPLGHRGTRHESGYYLMRGMESGGKVPLPRPDPRKEEEGRAGPVLGEDVGWTEDTRAGTVSRGIREGFHDPSATDRRFVPSSIEKEYGKQPIIKLAPTNKMAPMPRVPLWHNFVYPFVPGQIPNYGELERDPGVRMQEGGAVRYLPREDETEGSWPKGVIVLGPGHSNIDYPYKDKLAVETSRAQLNPMSDTGMLHARLPPQWLRMKRDRVQDFMEGTPPPTGGFERQSKIEGQLRQRQPEIAGRFIPTMPEMRGEEPSSLALQLGYSGIGRSGTAGPPDVPLPRPRPYQEGGRVALPDALINHTRRYLADQIAGVEREHEKQDPYEALIEERGGHRKRHPSEGGHDEGRFQSGGVIHILKAAEEAAKARMLRAARGETPIKGLPQKPLDVGGEKFVPGPSADVREAARQYMDEKGLPYTPVENYVPVNEDRARLIAKAYDVMPHRPESRAVQRAYEALANETRDQYEVIKRMGAKFEPVPSGMPDPYGATPRLAAKDFLENKHMYYFPTEQGFGSEASGIVSKKGQKMLEPSGVKIEGKEVPFNDLFRIVHDVFGHHKEGVGFRAAGEENAWRSHGRMYSPEALPAMTNETRGQNSWVNFGPYAEKNKGASAAETIYAPQKLGIMPSWVVRAGRMYPLGLAGAAVLPRGEGDELSEEAARLAEPPPQRKAEGGEIASANEVAERNRELQDKPLSERLPDVLMRFYANTHPALRASTYGPAIIQGLNEGAKETVEQGHRMFTEGDFDPKPILQAAFGATGPLVAAPAVKGAVLGSGPIRSALTKAERAAPREAPYPQYAEEYPPVGTPIPKTDPETGKKFLGKGKSPEAKKFMKAREGIREEMQTEGYQPYYDPAKRTPVDPSNYPPANVDTLTLVPKGAETVAKYLEQIDAPATRAALQAAFKRGVKLGPDAQDWYFMGQLEADFVKELGPAAGRQAFLDRFVVPMAATTSGNRPEPNLLMAHYLNYLKQKGAPMPRGQYEMPSPMGGRFGMKNVEEYESIMGKGGYSALGAGQPKMHNFARSFLGDLSHAVMDEQMTNNMLAHMLKGARTKEEVAQLIKSGQMTEEEVKAAQNFMDNARKTAYGLLEKPVHAMAARKGVAPGAVQDTSWAGFRDEPPQPMISVVNEAIERTHRLTGMPREEIVRRGLIRNEIPLYTPGAVPVPTFQDQGGSASQP